MKWLIGITSLGRGGELEKLFMNSTYLNIIYSEYFKKYLKRWRFLRRLLVFFKCCVPEKLFIELSRLLKDIIRLDEKDLIVPEYEKWISKSNKKLFIIGAGASLNNLSKRNWDEINDNFSMGLNYFLMHEFRANIYILECGRSADEQIYNDLYLQILSHKKHKSDLLINNLHLPEDLAERKTFLTKLEELKCSYQIHLPIRLPTQNIKILKFILNSKNLLIPKSDPAFGIHHNSTLAYAYNLGISLGYKEIILVGFDLNNVDYFFYHQNTAMAKQLTLLYREAFKNRSEHRTNDRKIANSYNTITTSEFLELHYKHVALPQGTEVYIANPKSKLAEFLPTYTWEHQ